MKPKPILALMAIIGLSLVVIAEGCSHHRRGGRASGDGSGKPGDNIAPSDIAKEGEEPAFSIVDKGGAGVDLPEREEIRRTYRLEPGARVSVDGINGRVDVETADTETAEVLIVRSAKKREDLQFHKIEILHEADDLRIRVEDDRRSIFSAFGSTPEGRQRVILRLPRKIRFGMHGLNGQLAAGGIDGEVEINGVNGSIKIAQATGKLSLHGVNGDTEATIAKLSGDGIVIGGVNGGTTLRFTGDVNADVEAHGMNGRVESDLPNIVVQKREGFEGFGRYQARIGSGGARIKINGVNGDVHLDRAEKTTADSSKSPVKARTE